MNEIPHLIQVSLKYQLDRRTKRIFSSEPDSEDSFDFEDDTAARLVYEDRMQGWFFDPARELVDKDHTVAAVHVVTPLIEALQIYREGHAPPPRKSHEFFYKSAKQIFPYLKKRENESALRVLYKGVRCGFAHQGFIQYDVGLQKYNVVISSKREIEPINWYKGELSIYAAAYVAAIEKAFKGYYTDIEKDLTTRQKFINVWKTHWNLKSLNSGSGASTEV